MNYLLLIFLLALPFLFLFYFKITISSVGVFKVYGLKGSTTGLTWEIAELKLFPFREGKLLYVGVDGFKIKSTRIKAEVTRKNMSKPRFNATKKLEFFNLIFYTFVAWIDFELCDFKFSGPEFTFSIESLKPSKNYFDLDKEFLRIDKEASIASLICRKIIIKNDSGIFEFEDILAAAVIYEDKFDVVILVKSIGITDYKHREPFATDELNTAVNKTFDVEKLVEDELKSIFRNCEKFDLKSPNIYLGLEKITYFHDLCVIESRSLEIFCAFETLGISIVQFCLKVRSRDFEGRFRAKNSNFLMSKSIIFTADVTLMNNNSFPKIKVSSILDIQKPWFQLIDQDFIQAINHHSPKQPSKNVENIDFAEYLNLFHLVELKFSINIPKICANFAFADNDPSVGVEFMVQNTSVTIHSGKDYIQGNLEFHDLKLWALQNNSRHKLISKISTLEIYSYFKISKNSMDLSLRSSEITVFGHSVDRVLLSECLHLKRKLPQTENREKRKVSFDINLKIDVASVESYMKSDLGHILSATVDNIHFNSNSKKQRGAIKKLVICATPLEGNVIEVVKTKDFYVKKDDTEPFTLLMQNVDIKFSLAVFYIAIKSIESPLMTFRSISSPKNYYEDKEPALLFAVKINQITLQMELPEKAKISFVFSSIKVSNNAPSQITTDFERIELFIYKKPGEQTNFINFHRSKLLIDKNEQVEFTFEMEQVEITIPHDYYMHNVVENIILLYKGCKNVVGKTLNIPLHNKFISGKTFVEEISVPNLTFRLERLEIVVIDDAFEAVLGRNYRIGYDANLQRINRTDEFSRKMKMKYSFLNGDDLARLDDIINNYERGKTKLEKLVEKAWFYSQEFNSIAYIGEIKKKSLEKLPPLMYMVVRGFDIHLQRPNLKKTLEELLHDIDPSTPADLIYDDLIAFQVKTSTMGCEVRLRDFSIPLFSFPTSVDTECSMEALLIVAEPFPKFFKDIYLPLYDTQEGISLKKGISPTKFYCESVSTVSTCSRIELCIGAPYEPTLADLINIIDNFTTPTEDPSPPLGWWDKLRLVFQGTNQFKIHGNGQVVLKILGSISPRFDPRKHAGVEGIEIVMSNGLDIELGPALELNCGELKLTLPRQSGHAHPDSKPMTCLAKLFGGVRLTLNAEFLAKNTEKDVNAWINHHQVFFQADPKTNPLGDDVEIKDSFEGFRSNSIRISVELESPKTYYSGLAAPQNVLFLNNDTLEGFNNLMLVYQSLLTNVPIRRGNLFKSDPNRDMKPKLGRTINSFSLRTMVKPLVLSYILGCEDSSEAVGVRMRAEEMLAVTVFRHYSVERTASELKILDRQPISTWIRTLYSMNLVDIEGCAISYCTSTSDFFIPPHAKFGRNELNDWVFNEDLDFTNFDKLSVKPFLWAPKMDILSIEPGQESNVDITPIVYQHQIRILKLRLLDLDSHIFAVKKLITSIEGRISVFFESSQQQLSNLLRESNELQKRRNVISKAIEYAEMMMERSLLNDEHISQCDQYKTSVQYESKYFVHDVKILWTEHVRNIVFRLVDSVSTERALAFCLSNAASRITAELIEEYDIPPENRLPSIKVPRPKVAVDSENDNIGQLIEELLKHAKEGKSILVQCEGLKQSTNGDDAFSSVEFTGKDFNSVDPAHYIDNGLLIQLINPQVKFEIPGSNIEDISFVVITARKIQVEYSREVDSTSRIFGILGENQDRIVRYTDTWTLEKTQAFAEQKDATTYASEFIGFIEWVPVEFILDESISDGKYSKLIDQTEVTYRKIEPNPLYVKRQNDNLAIEGHSEYHLTIPQLKFSASSKEYFVWYELVRFLLFYQDSKQGERSERAKNMLLTLEQCENLDYYREYVNILQKKIRQSNYLLNYGKRGDIPLTEEECELAKVSRASCKVELFALIEGFRNLKVLQTNKKSLNISWKFHVKFEQFEWMMLQEKKLPLCRWTIQGLNFCTTNKEDQSNVNTLEIDRTFLEDLTNDPVFAEVISMLQPVGNEINYDKQKAIRIFWRENMPVAGIQVVEHFEVNVHPLMIQITYDFGAQLSHYMFNNPQKTSKFSRTSIYTSENKTKEDNLNLRTEEPFQLKQMQSRANQNMSFIYIKVPGVHHCLSYRRSKENNFEDLDQFSFFLPDLEYRNKTWTWLDFLQALKMDAFRIVLANTRALVKEKIFKQRRFWNEGVHDREEAQKVTSDLPQSESHRSKGAGVDYLKRAFLSVRKKRGELQSDTSSIMSQQSYESFININDKNSTDSLLKKGKLILGKHFTISRAI